MPSIRKSLLQFTFSGANMRRWNDKLCPVSLYEIDKQAHKMLVAWILLEVNSQGLSLEERLHLGHEVVERGLFDYFYRLVITDIKPPVFYRIKENEANYRELTGWVLGELQPVLEPLGGEFWNRCVTYHEARQHDELADKILAAAHFYASRWEFNVIRPHNSFDEEMDEIARSFDARLESLREVPGVPELMAGSASYLGRFANLCGQLRFQIRWSSTPRVPPTSVLGHMFLVGCFAYYFSLSVGAVRARSLNNFFSGLVHDLPELLTRDIITPVKRSVPQLAGIIRDCENQEMERRVYAPLREGGYAQLVERLQYYLGHATGSEFHETVRGAFGVQRLESFDELQARYNEEALDPKDGSMLKVCDTLTAFMEANASIRGGITSPHLYEAIARIRNDFRHKQVGPISIGTLLADFD